MRDCMAHGDVLTGVTKGEAGGSAGKAARSPTAKPAMREYRAPFVLTGIYLWKMI
jgi:hypothetical protein